MEMNERTRTNDVSCFFFILFSFSFYFFLLRWNDFVSVTQNEMKLMLIYIVDKRRVPFFPPHALRSNEMRKENRKKWKER